MTETSAPYSILSLEVAPQSLRNDRPTLEQLEQQGKQLKAKQDRLWLDIGNWAVTVAHYYGASAYERLLAVCGFDNQASMVEDWAYVARNVPPEVQRSELSFSHHRAVAPIKDHALQDKLLQLAVDSKLTVNELRTNIKWLNGNDEPPQPPPGNKSDRLFETEQELINLEVKYQEERTARHVAEQQARQATGKTKAIVDRITALMASLSVTEFVFNPGGEFERIRGELEKIRQEIELA